MDSHPRPLRRLPRMQDWRLLTYCKMLCVNDTVLAQKARPMHGDTCGCCGGHQLRVRPHHPLPAGWHAGRPAEFPPHRRMPAAADSCRFREQSLCILISMCKFYLVQRMLRRIPTSTSRCRQQQAPVMAQPLHS